jgi:hypothetical protein
LCLCNALLVQLFKLYEWFHEFRFLYLFFNVNFPNCFDLYFPMYEWINEEIGLFVLFSSHISTHVCTLKLYFFNEISLTVSIATTDCTYLLDSLFIPQVRVMLWLSMQKLQLKFELPLRSCNLWLVEGCARLCNSLLERWQTPELCSQIAFAQQIFHPACTFKCKSQFHKPRLQCRIYCAMPIQNPSSRI